MAAVVDVPFYTDYLNATGPVPMYCVASSVFFLVALIGVIFNLSLIWITFKEKNLRGTTNFLIALTSLCEALHQSFDHFTFFVVTISGLNFIPYRTAFFIQWPALFGVAGAQMAMFSTAVDRLFCVFFPFKYNMVSTRAHLSVHLALTFLCGTFLVIEGCRYMIEHTTFKTTGAVPDLLSRPLGDLLNQYLVPGLGLPSIACYIAIWIRLRLSRRHQQQQQQHSTSMPKNNKNHHHLPSPEANTNNKIFKCLFCIIAVELGGYMIVALETIAMGFISPNGPLGNYSSYIYVGLLLNISAGAGPPILYEFSTDYREAYNKHLIGPLFQRICWCFSAVTTTKVHNLKQEHQQQHQNHDGTGRQHNNKSPAAVVFTRRQSQQIPIRAADRGGTGATGNDLRMLSIPRLELTATPPPPRSLSGGRTVDVLSFRRQSHPTSELKLNYNGSVTINAFSEQHQKFQMEQDVKSTLTSPLTPNIVVTRHFSLPPPPQNMRFPDVGFC